MTDERFEAELSKLQEMLMLLILSGNLQGTNRNWKKQVIFARNILCKVKN
jgi:hypothetical protein